MSVLYPGNNVKIMVTIEGLTGERRQEKESGTFQQFISTENNVCAIVITNDGRIMSIPVRDILITDI